jgi:2-oxoisovalerate dehydrogenase E1 component
MMMAPWRRFIGENSIVGAGVPIACGTAMASLARNDGTISIVTFGDGAMSQGALHEGFVFAAYRNLPVVFVCENNAWSEFTQTSTIVKLDRLAKRAAAYGMPGVTIEGNDPIAVRDTVLAAAERARAGHGPSLIECTVPRLWGHYNNDIEHYRSKEDKARAQQADPIEVMAQRLIASGAADAARLAEIRSDVDRELDDVQARVLAAPPPDTRSARTHIIAPAQDKRPRALPTEAGDEVRYIQAVNEALRRELEARPEVIVYGEDVGKSGGIFGASRYLQREFGPERVFDTPISESAILGSAVGAAVKGMRPIVEIMWGDFLLVALDQIINQASNIRYLTEGRSSVPLVVRTQQGVTPGSCAQHSQSLEALLFHIPGIKLGLPTTPQDAYDMLRAAVADPDPVVIIEARALYQTSGLATFDDNVPPVGGASVRRKGADVAILTWGTTVRLALDAAESLANSGISAEVLDLRWLAPLDDEAIDQSVTRCGGRALVLHEANVTGGVGAEIAARIAERHPGAAIRRLGAPDIRVPASPVLQESLMPNAERIAAAVRSLLPAVQERR